MSTEKVRKRGHNYLKYSGLGFQFAAMIIIAIFLGRWIDEKLSLGFPVFVLTFILIFFGGFMYKLYIELIRKK